MKDKNEEDADFRMWDEEGLDRISSEPRIVETMRTTYFHRKKPPSVDEL